MKFSLEYFLMASYATNLYPSAMADPNSVWPMIETTVSVCSRNNGEWLNWETNNETLSDLKIRYFQKKKIQT